MAARNLFSPHPQQHTSSPGDAGEEQQLLAQTVNAITLALAGAILLSFISSFLFGGVRPNTLLIDLVMLLVTLVVRRLLSIQQIRPATILLIAAIFPLITILLIGVGTVRTPAASAYIILVILAGIIFELRGAVVTALLASLAVFGLIWAEQAGRLPPAAPFTSYLQGLTYAVSFCLAGALSNYILRLIRRALDRSRQDITERKQAERLQEAVYRIAAAALEAETLQALYPQIHHHIAEVMYASNFYIALYDEPSDQIRFVYFADEYDQLDEGPIAPGSGLTARVLHSHQPLLYRLDQDPQGFGAELIGTPCRVWLGVPLMVHDRCLGVMTVQHYSDPLAFTLREQRILEYVSTQVATAIDRKRSEEAIRQVERRSQAMIENAPDGILILDQAGALQYASPSALRLFGYPAAEVLGSSVFGYAHPDDLARMLTGMRNVLRDPTISHPIEYRMRHKHGHYIWTEITTKNLLAEPSVQGVVINFRDITERKLAGEQLQRSQAELAALNAELEQRVEARTADLRQSEQSLRRSRDALSASNAALETANRLKNEFLASMRHALLTPLTGI
ncbi:MAG: PAS domain S-box protein, partial [Chloroflexota bacterium]